MCAGQRGPTHIADQEQVWVVLNGRLEVHCDSADMTAAEGDAITIAAGATRQVTAITDIRAVVASLAGSSVTTADGQTRLLPWAA
jgi:quercetin dioxygenase-like cupin family protein